MKNTNPVMLTRIDSGTSICNVCLDHTYKDDIHGLGSHVDTLYRLHVGQQSITLCDVCRKHVATVLAKNI